MNRQPFNPEQWRAAAPLNPTSSAAYATSSPRHAEIETLVQRIEAGATDIAPRYDQWRDVGFALADEMGESGRAYFHRISRFYPAYTTSQSDLQYTRCMKAKGHGITINTLFHLAKEAGIILHEYGVQGRALGAIASQEIADEEERSPTEEELFKEMPTFSPQLTELPTLLRQITQQALTPEEADLMLLGALTVISSCLPHVFGVYDQRIVYPNLFLFVTAQASAGKGRLSLCRHLVDPVHQELRNSYTESMQAYKLQQAEYVINKKNGSVEQPVQPPLQTLFIPANSSATAVYQILNDNQGVGLMFETEGDTLANTFKSDYGNFSDGFRKAFHHETISYTRRKEREFVELQAPRLSVLLSGTPRQIQALIPDVENGLFSRFMFYAMNLRLSWNDVFEEGQDTGTLDKTFVEMGAQFHRLYHILQASGPMRFSLTQPQQNEFNTHFETIQAEYAALFGLDFVASIRRLGLITYRIAMILNTLRIFDDGEIGPTRVCGDDDFRNALAIGKILLCHTIHVFEVLQAMGQEEKGEAAPLRTLFFDMLPKKFTRARYLACAEKLKLSAKCGEKYIATLIKAGKIRHSGFAKYEKVKEKKTE